MSELRGRLCQGNDTLTTEAASINPSIEGPRQTKRLTPVSSSKSPRAKPSQKKTTNKALIGTLVIDPFKGSLKGTLKGTVF